MRKLLNKKQVAAAIILMSGVLCAHEVYRIRLIQYKMSMREVNALLGEGESVTSGLTAMSYKSMFGRVVVHFGTVIKDNRLVNDGVISASLSPMLVNRSYPLLPVLDSMTRELAQGPTPPVSASD